MGSGKLNPITTVLAPVKYHNQELYEENASVINELLGLAESGWEKYLKYVNRVRSTAVENCLRDKDSRLCVYKYRWNSVRILNKIPVLSAMRGAVVRWYDNGEYKPLAMPFPKFFNYREVPETENPPGAGFVVTEKLDGSLVVCWRDVDGELRCSTRGVLDYYVAGGRRVPNVLVRSFFRAVERFRLGYELDSLVSEGRTVMFELVGSVPASRMAVDDLFVVREDDKWTPYFLAVRDEGGDIDYNVENAFPRPAYVRVSSIDDVVETVRSFDDKEGVVLYYPGRKYRDGPVFWWWDYLVKVKSTRYIFKTVKGGWRSLARKVIYGEYDDLVAVFEEGEERDFIDEVQILYEEISNKWNKLTGFLPLDSKTRNRLIHTFNMGWLVKYLDADEDSEKSLRKLVLRGMPRKKRQILSYLNRILAQIERAEQIIIDGKHVY